MFLVLITLFFGATVFGQSNTKKIATPVKTSKPAPMVNKPALLATICKCSCCLIKIVGYTLVVTMANTKTW